jgi:hypothetical protein
MVRFIEYRYAINIVLLGSINVLLPYVIFNREIYSKMPNQKKEMDSCMVFSKGKPLNISSKE